jgi:hypothetical protein
MNAIYLIAWINCRALAASFFFFFPCADAHGYKCENATRFFVYDKFYLANILKRVALLHL